MNGFRPPSDGAGVNLGGSICPAGSNKHIPAPDDTENALKKCIRRYMLWVETEFMNRLNGSRHTTYKGSPRLPKRVGGKEGYSGYFACTLPKRSSTVVPTARRSPQLRDHRGNLPRTQNKCLNLRRACFERDASKEQQIGASPDASPGFSG